MFSILSPELKPAPARAALRRWNRAYISLTHKQKLEDTSPGGLEDDDEDEIDGDGGDWRRGESALGWSNFNSGVHDPTTAFGTATTAAAAAEGGRVRSESSPASWRRCCAGSCTCLAVLQRASIFLERTFRAWTTIVLLSLLSADDVSEHQGMSPSPYGCEESALSLQTYFPVKGTASPRIIPYPPPLPLRSSTAPEAPLQKQALLPMPGYEDYRPSTTPLGEATGKGAGAAGAAARYPFRPSTRTRWRWRVGLTAAAADPKAVLSRPSYSCSSRGGHSRQTSPAGSSLAVWGYAGGGSGGGIRRQGRDRGRCPCPMASCHACSASKR